MHSDQFRYTIIGKARCNEKQNFCLDKAKNTSLIFSYNRSTILFCISEYIVFPFSRYCMKVMWMLCQSSPSQQNWWIGVKSLLQYLWMLSNGFLGLYVNEWTMNCQKHCYIIHKHIPAMSQIFSVYLLHLVGNLFIFHRL